ncbi:MAG TPA: hypothetical protein VNO81_03255 [Candidatus Nitrosotenuis sp.]|nr:hypothetical protein [Candidatus Nitrosotenuis sp.]
MAYVVTALLALIAALLWSRRRAATHYPVAGGRILVRARLAGQDPSPPPLARLRRRLVSRWLSWQVRGYLPALGREPLPHVCLSGRREPCGVVRGWEESLVPVGGGFLRGLASGLVAAGLVLFTLTGLGPRPAGPGIEPVRRDFEGEPGRAWSDPAAWQRGLLADISAPAPHTFRKNTGHTNVGVGHSNNATLHANTPGTPHTNTP